MSFLHSQPDLLGQSIASMQDGSVVPTARRDDVGDAKQRTRAHVFRNENGVEVHQVDVSAAISQGVLSRFRQANQEAGEPAPNRQIEHRDAVDFFPCDLLGSASEVPQLDIYSMARKVLKHSCNGLLGADG
jgi:hypothetical protein